MWRGVWSCDWPGAGGAGWGGLPGRSRRLRALLLRKRRPGIGRNAQPGNQSAHHDDAKPRFHSHEIPHSDLDAAKTRRMVRCNPENPSRRAPRAASAAMIVSRVSTWRCTFRFTREAKRMARTLRRVVIQTGSLR